MCDLKNWFWGPGFIDSPVKVFKVKDTSPFNENVFENKFNQNMTYQTFNKKYIESSSTSNKEISSNIVDHQSSML